jgi:hypothetical protein
LIPVLVVFVVPSTKPIVAPLGPIVTTLAFVASRRLLLTVCLFAGLMRSMLVSFGCCGMCRPMVMSLWCRRRPAVLERGLVRGLIIVPCLAVLVELACATLLERMMTACLL